MITITAVPESLTRQDFVDWLASVGIDPSLCKSITIDRDGIHATVYAQAPDGSKYAHWGSDKPATHTLHIRVEDPD